MFPWTSHLSSTTLDVDPPVSDGKQYDLISKSKTGVLVPFANLNIFDTKTVFYIEDIFHSIVSTSTVKSLNRNGNNDRPTLVCETQSLVDIPHEVYKRVCP